MTTDDGDPRSGLGDSIREARRSVGLTQGQLAALVRGRASDRFGE